MHEDKYLAKGSFWYPFQVVLGQAFRGFNWWVSFALNFQCWYFCDFSCLFYLRFNFDVYVSGIMHL